MADRYFVRGEIWVSFHIKADDFKEAQHRAKEIIKEKIQSIFEEYELWWILATPEHEEEINNGKEN